MVHKTHPEARIHPAIHRAGRLTAHSRTRRPGSTALAAARGHNRAASEPARRSLAAHDS